MLGLNSYIVLFERWLVLCVKIKQERLLSSLFSEEDTNVNISESYDGRASRLCI